MMKILTIRFLIPKMVILAITFIFLSCGQKTKDSDEGIENVSRGESNREAISTAFDSQLSSWKNHWQEYMNGLSVDSFQEGEESDLPDMTTEIVHEAKPGPEFQKKMIYSPNKSKYIDLYSYKLIITNKNGRLTGGINPDAEAILVDPEKGTQNRLLFMGPAGGIEDAAWINDEELIITGFGEAETGEFFPLFWHINLRNMAIVTYEYPASTNYDGKSFIKKKFANVKFD